MIANSCNLQLDILHHKCVQQASASGLVEQTEKKKKINF